MAFELTVAPSLVPSDERFELARIIDLARKKAKTMDAFDVDTTVFVHEVFLKMARGVFIGPQIEDKSTRPPNAACFVIAKDKAAYLRHEKGR